MKKADYSQIASTYDSARILSEENIKKWIGLIGAHSGAQKGDPVLDLGCGTGRFAIPMARQLGFKVAGADQSDDMLTKAAAKEHAELVKWEKQNCESLTYADRGFQVVFMSHLLHHVDDPMVVVRECQRVLRNGGAILIRYGAIEQIRDDVEHRFFPEAIAIDDARTPSRNKVKSWLKEAGFADVSSIEIVQRTYQSAAHRIKAIRLKSTSVLSLITPESHARGLKEIRDYVEKNPDDPWLVEDRLTFTYAHKPADSP